MKLANELLLAKRHFAEEVAQLRAQFDREQAAHGADRKDLSGKLQLVEAEAIAMLEEQDEEHDHERQKNQSQWRAQEGIASRPSCAHCYSAVQCDLLLILFRFCSLPCMRSIPPSAFAHGLRVRVQTSTPQW